MNTELEIFMREIGVMTPVDLDLEDDDDDFDVVSLIGLEANAELSSTNGNLVFNLP